MPKHRRWMPFNIPDYLGDTQHLSTTEHGCYVLLILHYWQRGGLPNDDRALARIAKMHPSKFAKMRPTISAFFQPGWRHKRIDYELQRADEAHEKKSRAGTIGNTKRWQKPSHCDRRAMYLYNKNITSSEYVAAREEEADRESKQSELEPSQELNDLVHKRWRRE